MTKIVDEPKILRYEYDINGEKIPVYSAKVETTITNMKTGLEYNSEEEADADVADPNTETKAEHIRRDVNVIAPRLFTGATVIKK
tara:strand:+ start:4135 stop:4389 length:255 start_codon:yes stop_codon:yes gene_type:complete